MSRTQLLLFIEVLSIACLGGCSGDERAVQLSREASNRQAEQNARMAEVVQAETKAQQETARLQRELHRSQTEIGHQRDVLEAERRDIAAQRRHESLLAPAIEGLAALLLVTAVLVFCWWLLIGLCREGEPEQTAAVNELLIEELVRGQADGLLPPPSPSPTAIAGEPIDSVSAITPRLTS